MFRHHRIRWGARRPLTLIVVLLGLLLTPGSGALASPGQVFEGRFFLRHSDDFDGGIAASHPMLELEDGTLLRLDFGAGRTPDLFPGERIQLRGVRQGVRLTVADGSTQVTGASTSSTTPGGMTKRLLVLLVNFTDDRSEPLSPPQVRDAIFDGASSTAAYYAEQTFGAVSVTGDVRGWLQLGVAATTCSYSAWGLAADSLATAQGIDLASYTNVMYLFPKVAACGWAGAAQMPGTRSWINGPTSQGNVPKKSIAHEFGHNLGVHHANGWSCTQAGVRVSISASCSTVEYADRFDVMGTEAQAVTRHMNAWHKLQLGALPAGNVRTVTASGTFTLGTLEPPSSDAQLIKIPRGSTGTSFWLDFRQPYGLFDNYPASANAVGGVLVRVAPEVSSRVQSQLLDMTPVTSAWDDAALLPGQTFTDPASEVSITTSSVSNSGAVVQVSIGGSAPAPTPSPSPSPSPSPPPDTTPPTRPGGLSATGLDPNRISLAWSASTDDVGVVGYRVFRDSALVASVTATAYTDIGLSPSTGYIYEVVAVDAAGNVSPPAQASGTTPTVVDVQAPTAPSNLTATVRKGGKVVLRWDMSTDDVGVAGYDVYRDGRRVGTTTGTRYAEALRRKLTSATYHVVAFDAAGNVSAASNSARVRL